jgi:hypothetical protein
MARCYCSSRQGGVRIFFSRHGRLTASRVECHIQSVFVLGPFSCDVDEHNAVMQELENSTIKYIWQREILSFRNGDEKPWISPKWLPAGKGSSATFTVWRVVLRYCNQVIRKSCPVIQSMGYTSETLAWVYSRVSACTPHQMALLRHVKLEVPYDQPRSLFLPSAVSRARHVRMFLTALTTSR